MATTKQYLAIFQTKEYIKNHPILGRDCEIYVEFAAADGTDINRMAETEFLAQAHYAPNVRLKLKMAKVTSSQMYLKEVICVEE